MYVVIVRKKDASCSSHFSFCHLSPDRDEGYQGINDEIKEDLDGDADAESVRQMVVEEEIELADPFGQWRVVDAPTGNFALRPQEYDVDPPGCVIENKEAMDQLGFLYYFFGDVQSLTEIIVRETNRYAEQRHYHHYEELHLEEFLR